MGGQEGSRGYLVQTAIALLESLDDPDWESVTLEPDHASEKVDVLWVHKTGRKAIQVKSSANQIGKADAEAWADDLQKSKAADTYKLMLVGPCAQSVAEMKSFGQVAVPCPKALDITGLLNQAAHLLDKFLLKEGLGQKSAHHRELMVGAMITQLSLLSTGGQATSRSELKSLCTQWIKVSEHPNECWEQVTFANQRDLDHAVAGQRLTPADVQACPPFSARGEIIQELDRSHLYELVGVPGCGKSITAWQVAKHFHDNGFCVWRPRALTGATDLLATIPGAERQFIVIDDAQRFGREFASRLIEAASAKLKVLLVSTVDDPLLGVALCINPAQCVDELKNAMLARRRELMPIVRKFDDRIGDRVSDIDLENRIRDAGRQKSPWEFFWILRGGWRTARREFDTFKQFPNANDVLSIIAMGQIVSCDAGVTRIWLVKQSKSIGIVESAVDKEIGRLVKLGAVLAGDELRTKHLQYSYQLLDEVFSKENRNNWGRILSVYVSLVTDTAWSLKGVSWLLDAAAHSDAFRFKVPPDASSIVATLIGRCTAEGVDTEWAAGCLGRLFNSFGVSVQEMLKHRELLLRWTVQSTGLLAYFCSNFVNLLINESKPAQSPGHSDMARSFNDDVDVIALVTLSNRVSIDDFYTFGSLLNRLAFYGPRWSKEFIERLDWSRLREIMLGADADHAELVDKMLYSVCRLAQSSAAGSHLSYLEQVIPYIVKAVNARPARALNEMHDIFWSCLGFAPKFLRGSHDPTADDHRIARTIVSQLNPRAFAEAMETSLPRELEGLSRSFEFIYEIDQSFTEKVAGAIQTDRFFSSTSDEWRQQSEELLHVLGFFAQGRDRQPARTWVDANQDVIVGPLRPRLAWISPDVAVSFHKAGRGVVLVAANEPRWFETSLAIFGIMNVDRRICAEIVEQQLPQLEAALYRLTLKPLTGIAHFFRLIYELSPQLFDKFLVRLDLDKPEAKKTLEQIVRSQPNERRAYMKLARKGTIVPGKMGLLSKTLLERLQ
ncbi:MAG: hypothetical protein ACR2FY_14130 [Pirellulaceae bacterium]